MTSLEASCTGGFSAQDPFHPTLASPQCPRPPQRPLVLDQLVYVVLGAVFTGGYLKHKGYAEQGLLGIPVRNNLKWEGERARLGGEAIPERPFLFVKAQVCHVGDISSLQVCTHMHGLRLLAPPLYTYFRHWQLSCLNLETANVQNLFSFRNGRKTKMLANKLQGNPK